MAILNVNGNVSSTGVVLTNTVAFKASFSGDKAIGSAGVRMWTDANGFNGNIFTTIDYNIGGGWNGSNTTFTAPYAGLYYLSTWLATNNSAPAQNYTSAEYYINGSRRSNGWQKQNSGYQVWRSWDIFDLAKDDAITFGGEWESNNVTFKGSPRSWIMGYLIG